MTTVSSRNIQTALSLLHVQVMLDTARHIQRADGLHEKRNAGVGSHVLFQGLWIELKQKLTCGFLLAGRSIAPNLAILHQMVHTSDDETANRSLEGKA